MPRAIQRSLHKCRRFAFAIALIVIAGATYMVWPNKYLGWLLPAVSAATTSQDGGDGSLSAASSPGAVSFAASSYSVNESGGSANITLTRTGGTDNQITVKVDLTDVTTSKADYSGGPGSVNTVFNSLPGFTSATGTNNVVFATALQADGKIILGGGFTLCRGVPRKFIARLNQDGTLDTTFDPGTGPDQGGVGAIAIQPDGKIIISGFFFHYNGTPRRNIARLNPDGTLDTTFDPSPVANAPVSLDLLADGKIIVSGSFSEAGYSRPSVLRLNSDGSLDATFDRGVGGNDSLGVRAIQPDGKIIIAGSFATYNGTSRGRLARLNSDGSIDTTFNPLVDAGDYVSSVALQPDGKIITVGSIYDVHGVHGLLRRLNADGSPDPSFNPGTGPNLGVQAVALQPDGKIIIAGTFGTYNGVARCRIARLNVDGSLDTTFDPGPGANNTILTLEVQGDGKIIIAGEFTDYNGGYRNYIAQVNGDFLVTWAAGDASNKTIQVPIVNDLLYESDETLNLSLTPLSGEAVTGNTPTSTLTIIDNDEPKIQFDGLDTMVLETGGRAIVFVNRSNTSVASTVDYATSDAFQISQNCQALNTGIASSRCDYATTIGTLRFAVGETFKAISIPLVNDAWSEGTENFIVTLSNPSGGSLGVSTSAVISIIDNDANSDAANPVDQNAFFVRQQYIDFLGREPDIAGYQGWQNIINNCPASGKDANGNFCDRVEVSAGFFRSPEFQDRGYFIYRFYSAVGKTPLYESFMPDLAKVSGFLSAQQLEDNKVAFVNEFMSRQDFQTRYGALNDPTAYTDALLQTVGLPNHPGRAAWIGGLTNNSLTRAQVLRQLVESTEVYQKYYNEAFVIMQYFGYLRRSADISYLNWIQTMNQTSGDYRTMINGFLNSLEYRQRFGR